MSTFVAFVASHFLTLDADFTKLSRSCAKNKLSNNVVQCTNGGQATACQHILCSSSSQIAVYISNL